MRATSHKCVYFLKCLRKKSLKISIWPSQISSPRNPNSKHPYLLTKALKQSHFFFFIDTKRRFSCFCTVLQNTWIPTFFAKSLQKHCNQQPYKAAKAMS